MENPIHSINSLFDQLGLESSDQAINDFIARNAPLPGHIKLHEADIWNPAQAALLMELKDNDADWAEFVDQLDARLR